MFHFTPKRIEAHICICFVAYKVYKELERTLRMMEIGMSVDKVLFIAKTITHSENQITKRRVVHRNAIQYTSAGSSQTSN